MIDKRSAGSYNHSHKKSVKSFAKALDIKYRIGQNSQLRNLRARHAQIKLNTNYSTHAQRQTVGKRPLFRPWAFFYVFRIGTIQSEKTLTLKKWGS